MSNIQICVNAVLPMFIYIVIGTVIKRAGMMNKEENTRFNKILFTFFYPVLLFDNIYSADLADLIDIRLVCFALAFIAVSVLIITAVIVRIAKDDAARGAMIQAIYRSIDDGNRCCTVLQLYSGDPSRAFPGRQS